MKRGALTVEGGTLILKNSTINHDDGYALYIHDDYSNDGSGENHIEMWNVTHKGDYPWMINEGATFTYKYVSRADVVVTDHEGNPVSGAVVQVRPGSGGDPAAPGLPTTLTTGPDGRAGFWATYIDAGSQGGIQYKNRYEVEHNGVTAKLDTSKPHTIATLVLTEPAEIPLEPEQTTPSVGVLLMTALLGVAWARRGRRDMQP